MTNIFLLRHGESEANMSGTISSVVPGPGLTDKGRDQIVKVSSDDIVKIDITKIYSSPFRRTVETMLVVDELENRKIEVIIDSRIQEIDYGIYDGLSKFEKGVFIEKTLERVLKGDNTIRFGITGENETEIITRIINFLIDAIEIEGNILVVTHQGIISVILQIFDELHGSKTKMAVNNGHLCNLVFQRSDKKALLKLLNEFRLIEYSPYTLRNNNNISVAKFFPSVDLNPAVPISTPFTFPLYKDGVVLAYDKMGWWNPIGGHIENGESWQDALRRESIEEAGVVIDRIEIVGYIEIQELFAENNKYPPLSLIPITISQVIEYREDWVSRETRERRLFTMSQALKALEKRSDNKQMFEIFKYIIKFYK